MRRTWNLAAVLKIVQKISENYCPCLYLLIYQVWWLRVVVQKIYLKMHPASCTNTHDVTDLLNHGMVKNTKTWISWEWNITFLWNEKALNPGFSLLERIGESPHELKIFFPPHLEKSPPPKKKKIIHPLNNNFLFKPSQGLNFSFLV